MHTIELEDVQGYVLREYRNMKFSRFVLLKVTDAEQARSWINSISDDLTNAVKVNKDQLPDRALNIAFAKDGLLALGLSKANLESFSPPYKEGMVTPHRQRLLGDIHKSDPEYWEWGLPEKSEAQILLMVFGKDKQTCKDYYDELKKGYKASGLKKFKNLDGQTLEDNKEHFGFRDGISQPIVRGSGRTGPEYNSVNPGEFILGYENNYFVFPDSPTIIDEQGKTSLLPPSGARPGNRDLGKNGTYMIIRQMQEHVDTFWEFMNKESQNEDGTVNEEASIKLASQMFGRWPSGAPLSKFPDKDPGGASDDNDFQYYHDDKDGFKCPFGSHIRRMNPRDNFEEGDKPGKSQILSNRHRLIRRARLYGEPIISSPTNHNPEDEVGLHFVCFAADISRQFEFLQYTWSNYPKIKQLYFDPDPIIGVMEAPETKVLGYDQEKKQKQPQQFTIQARPYNKVVKDLQRFVDIRGGAYFFLPSITAVRYLCTLED